MKQNMGKVDRLIRLILALIIAAFIYLSGQISGVLAIILGVVAVAFLFTAISGFCPAYLPFGLSTRGKGR